jgi:hypothetical protein
MFWYWSKTPRCQRPMCLLCTGLMINIKYIIAHRLTTIKEMGDVTSPVREREGQNSREYYINIS